MNPFFNRVSGQTTSMPGVLGNLATMMDQFNQFRSQFQGDPRQQVQNLLNSGKMTQEQFNQLSNMANQFQGMFATRR